ncbi:MAG: hypothetical protein WDN44_03825 [Sphingomonas sp.]
MSDDGSMARLPELCRFAERHGLRIGTIADLIEYRRRTERSIERTLEMPFESEFGDHLKMILYRCRIDGAEHVALVKGEVSDAAATLVRVHSVDLVTDLMRHSGPRARYVEEAMRAIGAHPGAAVMLFLRSTSMSWTQRYREGPSQKSPSLSLRDYGIGAQILRDLGVRDMVLLTYSQTPLRIPAIEGHGLNIVGSRPMRGEAPAAGRLSAMRAPNRSSGERDLLVMRHVRRADEAREHRPHPRRRVARRIAVRRGRRACATRPAPDRSRPGRRTAAARRHRSPARCAGSAPPPRTPPRTRRIARDPLSRHWSR